MRRLATPRGLIAGPLLALLAGGMACGSSTPAPARPAAPGFDAAAVPALGYLYRDTAAVVVLRSPRSLQDQLGWAPAAAALGVDLSLEQLDQAGIDLDAPIGAAAIDLSAGTTAVFARVVDAARTLAWIEAEARRRGLTLSRSRSAGADILLPTGSQGIAIVRRDETLIVLATNGPPSVRDLAAVRLASLERGDSLVEAEGFRRVMPALPAMTSLAAYLDFDQLSTSLAAPSNTEMQVRDLIREYERRRLAATGDERMAIERQLAVMRSITEAASRQRRLTTDLFATLGGVGFTATLEPGGVALEIAASPAPGSLPDRLLGHAPRPMNLASAIDARPLLLVDVGAEPSALVELLDLWLGSRGTDRASIDAAVAQATGRDLGQDLYANLTGAFGVAITTDGPLSLDPETLRQRLELLVRVGVEDPQRAAALVRASGGDQPGPATMDWPGFKPLLLSAAGDSLIATTDADAMKRLETAQAGGHQQRAIAMMVIDGWLVAILASQDPIVPRRIEPAGDPNRPGYQALVGQLETAQDQLTSLIGTNARGALERRLAIGAGLGSVSLLVHRDEGLVRARGQLASVRGSPRADLAALVTRLETHRAASSRETAAEAKLRAAIERLTVELGDQPSSPSIQP